ncbi:hypothetical protein BH18ACI2_BH18ACI2_02800 [soil metagenome]|jgi:hypothetical protein
MNSKQNLLMSALVICAALVVGASSHKFLVATVTQAQRPETAKTAPPKNRWEYCSVTRSGAIGAPRGTYWISYFNEAGVQISVVEEQATESHGPAKAIARLGDEGWEMVGQGPLEIRQGSLPAIYFKRLK